MSLDQYLIQIAHVRLLRVPQLSLLIVLGHEFQVDLMTPLLRDGERLHHPSEIGSVHQEPAHQPHVLLISLEGLLFQLRLELFHHLEVFSDISGQHILDQELTETTELLVTEVGEDVTLIFLEDVNGCGGVMLLEYAAIMVPDGQIGETIDLVVVGTPTMVHVVHQSRYHKSEVREVVNETPVLRLLYQMA